MSVRIVSLTLEGFKSFASKVELSFPGSIVAIVGPNGAGKSNICDAIAWVLGEQSARLLRSQTMGDVIFAGSAGRPPASAAQVTLVLESADGTGPRRLELSRRVLKDGTSEYRLGGRRVRLKDIQDTLAEAGLATRAYAIIEQGRISQVLSTKPTDRRALFEEAAGISHYRLRRQEAELKLAETRANLERVSDIVAEVRREYNSIRRQARQAQRFAQLRSELEAVKKTLSLLRLKQTSEELEKLERELGAARERHAQKAAQLSQAERELFELQQLWEEKAAAIAALREEQGRLAGQCQRLEGEETSLRRELETLRRRQEQVTSAIAETSEHIAAESLKEEELSRKLAEAQEEVQRVQAQASAAEKAAADAEILARDAEAHAEEVREKLLRTVAAATEARNRFHRLQLEVEHIRYQQTRLAAERERLEAHLQQAATGEQEAAAQEKALEEAFRAVQGERRDLETLADAFRRDLAELSQRRDGVEHQLWQVRHEREAVRRARAQLRALPEALARVLEERQLAGSVADFLNPPRELAELLDRAYGELLTLPVVEGEEAAARVLEKRPAGETVEVAIRDTSLPPPATTFLAEAGVAPQELGWLAASLPPLAVASDPKQAREIARDPNVVVVLPGGGWRQGQRLRVGDGRRGPAGALQLKQREHELGEREAALTAEKEFLLRAIQGKSAELREHEEKLAAVAKLARQRAEALAEASSRREARHRERTRLERELSALGVEAARLADDLEKAQESLAHAEGQAKLLEDRAEGETAQVEEAMAAAREARSRAARAHTEAERWRGQLALASERCRFAQRELEHHRRAALELAREHQSLLEEQGKLGQRQEEVAELLARTRGELERSLKLLAQGRETLASAEGELVQLKELVEARKREAAQRREEEQEANQHAVELTVRVAELSSQRAHLEEALGEMPEVRVFETADREALALRQKELEEQLAQLGPVNELAVQQEAELAERFRFLSEQKRDLERSLQSLQQSIAELDATSRERFQATLAEANRHFGEVFRELFGGGEAQVLLSDPESPLDSGVEVKVRPPGKQTQSVLLLSGGEKALAAVALLLALFRIRPAPFCVLDEVDAPLDDLNVERLCQHLRAWAHKTQFLLITHNRRTMAHADVLYGVTMEEPGVSRVVSVRLEEP